MLMQHRVGFATLLGVALALAHGGARAQDYEPGVDVDVDAPDVDVDVPTPDVDVDVDAPTPDVDVDVQTPRYQPDVDIEARPPIEEMEVEMPAEVDRDWVFIEALGGYGVQFGETDYLPAGAPGDWMHPIVHGWDVGGTAGFLVDENVALIASYDYTNARSRHGAINGVVDDIQGSIDYHTIVGGLRLYVPVGFGRLRGELAGGVILPYETELEFQYAPGLAPAGISGTGTRVDEYSVGFGGQAALGYDFPIVGGLYFATQVRYRLFEAENSGEETRLTNFVTDFGAQPPSATTTTIRYGDGAAQPATNSVQDVRLQVGLGWQF
jgi:hypothetical protein